MTGIWSEGRGAVIVRPRLALSPLLARCLACRLRHHRPRSLVHDVASDGFERAFAALDRFDHRRPFCPWLHRIVANRALDLLRSERRLADEEPPDLPDLATGSRLGDRSLLAAVGESAARSRIVVVGRFGVGMTPKQIARCSISPWARSTRDCPRARAATRVLGGPACRVSSSRGSRRILPSSSPTLERRRSRCKGPCRRLSAVTESRGGAASAILVFAAAVVLLAVAAGSLAAVGALHVSFGANAKPRRAVVQLPSRQAPRNRRDRRRPALADDESWLPPPGPPGVRRRSLAACPVCRGRIRLRTGRDHARRPSGLVISDRRERRRDRLGPRRSADRLHRPHRPRFGLHVIYGNGIHDSRSTARCDRYGPRGEPIPSPSPTSGEAVAPWCTTSRTRRTVWSGLPDGSRIWPSRRRARRSRWQRRARCGSARRP